MSFRDPKKLRAELVEQFFELVPDVKNYKELQEKCAQIAINYSVNQNWEMTCSLESANNIIKGLEHQRKELIKCLKEIVDAQYDKNSTLANLNNSVSEGKELLKKYVL